MEYLLLNKNNQMYFKHKINCKIKIFSISHNKKVKT